MGNTLKAAGETRAGDVLARMRSDIISCALKPGTKLRFETLRELYEVSFSTLREALSRLVAEGLVVAEGQRGFLVAPVSLFDLNDLTDVRVLVERQCIKLAIDRGDDRWEADIMAAFHRMDRLQSRLGASYYLSDEWATLHSAFHLSLVAACGLAQSARDPAEAFRARPPLPQDVLAVSPAMARKGRRAQDDHGQGHRPRHGHGAGSGRPAYPRDDRERHCSCKPPFRAKWDGRCLQASGSRGRRVGRGKFHLAQSVGDGDRTSLNERCRWDPLPSSHPAGDSLPDGHREL